MNATNRYTPVGQPGEDRFRCATPGCRNHVWAKPAAGVETHYCAKCSTPRAKERRAEEADLAAEFALEARIDAENTQGFKRSYSHGTSQDVHDAMVAKYGPASGWTK